MDEVLTSLVQKFEASEDASQRGRRDSERCRDYYDGRQLTSEEKATMQRRRQPVVIENVVQQKVDYLCGLERQTRTDPMAYPRTLKDQDSADVATDALRYVADDQRMDIKRSAVFQNMLVEGFGGVEVGAQRVRGGIDPKISWIAWDRLFFDPHSYQSDFSDANYLGYVTWMDLRDALQRWPKAKDILGATMAKPTSGAEDTYDDKPKWTYWSDGKRQRVRVVTIYYLESGQWMRCVYTLAGMLEEAAPSPFVGEDGSPENPLICASAYIDRDNDRYGPVRNWLTLQDEINKRRSKFLHLSNSRQVRISRTIGTDAEKVRRELTRPDGVIVADKDEVEVISTADLSAGHFQLLAEAKDAISRSGPNATMQGKGGDDQSGRAILALQQGGMIEMAPLLDNLRDWSIRVFRACWNRIRQFWQEERWVRITDDENAVRFAGVNTTQGALSLQKIAQAMQRQEIDWDTAQAYAAQIRSDPGSMQPANVVAEMDVDIQIDEVQNTPTLQIEQFEHLVQLASTGMVPIPPELIVEASSLRDKKRLLEIIEQQKQAPQPMQEQQMRMGEAKIAETASSAALKGAQAQNEAMKPMLEGMKLGAQGQQKQAA